MEGETAHKMKYIERTMKYIIIKCFWIYVHNNILVNNIRKTENAKFYKF